MEKYYILFPKRGVRGIPVFLSGMLHEEFNEKDPMRPMTGYQWLTAVRKEVSLPNKLWLISKDRLYTYDYYGEIFRGFLISKEFKDMMDTVSVSKYQMTQVQAISWKKKEITKKHYFYLKFNEDFDIIDYEKSQYEPDKKYYQKSEHKNLWVKRYKKVFLKTTSDLPDVFVIKDDYIGTKITCSEKFKQAIENSGIKTIEFVPIDEAAEYYNKVFSL